MDFLSEWIANIILFILLAVVTEMLLPQTGLQKYVKMVLGLLLIIIFLKPLFTLFSKEPDEVLKEAENLVQNKNNLLGNSIESKKIEIQSDINAYILEQTAVQLKDLSEKELMETFGYQIEDIEIELKEPVDHTVSSDDLLDNLKTIHVFLSADANEDRVEPVRDVSIQIGGEVKREKSEDTDKLASFFARQWGVDKERILITVERGKETDERS